MKRTFILLIAATFSIALFSCQKAIDTSFEPGTGPTGSTNGDASIIGTWKLISLEATTNSINEVISGSDNTKTITTSNYITENNTGTITFTATTATSNNISYSINSIAKGTLYENGALIDTFSSPFQASIPPSSSSVPYKRIGADSLYFQSGFMSGTTQATQPSGAKMKLVQNMMYLNQTINQNTTQVVQGDTVTSIAKLESKITLQKQ